MSHRARAATARISTVATDALTAVPGYAEIARPSPAWALSGMARIRMPGRKD